MDTTNLLYKYNNGNTEVFIYKDGSKIREYEEGVIPTPLHPESLDVKITNYCDAGCVYCHENSTRDGQHANLQTLLEVLSSLPAGVELAIGGGNPLSHPDLYNFLLNLKSRGLIANITVNQYHLEPFFSTIEKLINEDLIKGLGISVLSSNLKFEKKLMQLTPNIVFHTIVGITSLNLYNELIKIPKSKILILGYKTYGRGADYSPKTNRWTDLKNILPSLLGKYHLSFDNLALEQLQVKSLLTPEQWNRLYMGDDFTYTMYIDAVNENYAPTSRSDDRHSWINYSLIDYFQTFRNKG